jgi:hypothetical protein
MSTLNVTSIQNPAAPQANLSLNADGTVTLPVFTGGTAPLIFQAGTLWYNTTASALQIRNAANTTWVATASGGGGGTVTGVTATAPLVSSGGAAPNLTINAATTGALGAVQIGTNLQVTGGTISIFDASDTQKGVVEMATAAEAATGTSATLAAPVAFSVPKDAANMTGAAILPSGTTLQRPTPVAGMLRMNTDNSPDSLEAYDGAAAAWRQVAYVPSPTLPADLTISANTTLTNSTYVVNNFTINSGVTATLGSQSVTFICYGDVNIAGTINANLKGPSGGFQQAGGGYVSTQQNIGSNIGASIISSIVPFPANAYAPLASIVGSGGTAAAAASGGGQIDTQGGGAGGGIVIRSYKSITVTGTLTSVGGGGATNVVVPGAWVAGPGGGSGGSVILHATGNIAFSGTINVSGGNGGAAVNSGIGALTGANGGGGGGGGYVILESEQTLTNTGTILLTGGSAGANTGVVDAAGGGNGGSYGGRGGLAAGGPGPLAGSSGEFTTVGSPI